MYYKKNSKVDKTAKIARFCRVINSSIARYSYVGARSVLRNTNIGSFCSIAENVKIGYGNHPINRLSTSPLFYNRNNIFNRSFIQDSSFEEFIPTVIGHDVLIGANVFIKDGLKIGDGAIVGAGSVVTKNIAPYEVVAGNPARHIKYRFNEVIKTKVMALNWWDWPEDRLLANELFLKSFDIDDIDL